MRIFQSLYMVPLLLGMSCSSTASEQRAVVIRVPEPASATQLELNRKREELLESTKYGRGETKPWNERYLDHNPNAPFQGPTPGRMR